jgi:hypothetical protein
VGSTVDLKGCGNNSSPLGFDSCTIQPVASRYTDYAIPAQCTGLLHFCFFSYIAFKTKAKSKNTVLAGLLQNPSVGH